MEKDFARVESNKIQDIHLFVITDLEGTSGAVYGGYGLPPSKEGERSQLLMTLELNALIKGARQAGVRHFTVCEAHPFNKKRLIKGLKIVHNLDLLSSCNYLAFVGQHSRAGVIDGVLSHTGSARSILRLRINNIEVGEIGYNAALAGYYCIPTIFVSGDLAATEEAHKLIPNIETVAVSEGLGNHSAICLAPQKVHTLISEGIRRAIERRKTIKPLSFGEPVTFEMTMRYPAQADRMCLISHVIRKDSRTIMFSCKDFLEAYKMFLVVNLATRWWDSRKEAK